MAQMSLEAAYEAKQQTAAAVAAAETTLTDLQAQVQTALTDLNAQRGADAAADAALAAGVSQTPDGKAVRTTDGKVLLAFNGSVHTLDVIDASAVTFDDGQGDTPTPAPTPAPTPTPDPTPAPQPSPDSEPPPAPLPDDTPPDATPPATAEAATASWSSPQG